MIGFVKASVDLNSTIVIRTAKGNQSSYDPFCKDRPEVDPSCSIQEIFFIVHRLGFEIFVAEF